MCLSSSLSQTCCYRSFTFILSQYPFEGCCCLIHFFHLSSMQFCSSSECANQMHHFETAYLNEYLITSEIGFPMYAGQIENTSRWIFFWCLENVQVRDCGRCYFNLCFCQQEIVNCWFVVSWRNTFGSFSQAGFDQGKYS